MYKSQITAKQCDDLRNRRCMGLMEAKRALRKEELLGWIEECKDFESLKELIYILAERAL